MKVLKTIKLPALKGFGRLLSTLALIWIFIFLLRLNSYAGDAENLMDTVTNGDISTVKALLAKGADVNARNTNDGETVLIRASQYGHLDVIQALLAKGADVNAKDYNGMSALMAASGEGYLEIVQALLAKGADVNAKDGGGVTALIYASSRPLTGRLDVVQALLAKGADVNAKADGNNRTALMWASLQGHLEIVQALLAKGADVNAKDNDGETALIQASEYGHLKVVQALIAKGADVNAEAKNGETALSIAKAKRYSGVAQLLITAGAKEDESKLNNETVARSSIIAIAVACQSFRMSQSPPTYPANLNVLAKSNPPYIGSQLGDGEKKGYRFIYTRISANQYTCSASPKEPGITGDRIYFVDESGVVRLNNASGNPVE